MAVLLLLPHAYADLLVGEEDRLRISDMHNLNSADLPVIDASEGLLLDGVKYSFAELVRTRVRAPQYSESINGRVVVPADEPEIFTGTLGSEGLQVVLVKDPQVLSVPPLPPLQKYHLAKLLRLYGLPPFAYPSPPPLPSIPCMIDPSCMATGWEQLGMLTPTGPSSCIL